MHNCQTFKILGERFDPKTKNEKIRTQGLGFKIPPTTTKCPLSRLPIPANSAAYLSPSSGEMGAKAKKKEIAKKLKKGASDFSASSASKHEAHDFLPLEGGPAQKLPKTEVGENKATVLYIGRIPHGFYENEMEGFFKQFGTIKRLRIARNKKTGKSKHFGFIEFESREVAKVVADTMHSYLLFEHLLQVHLISPEHVHPSLWKGVNHWYKPLDWVKIEKKCQDKERTLDEHKKLVEGILKCDKKRRKRIEAAGIDYECPEIVGSIQAAPKKIRFDAE